MRFTAAIAALAMLIGCAERAFLPFSDAGPHECTCPVADEANALDTGDAAAGTDTAYNEDAMTKRGLLTGLVTLTLGAAGAGVLLSDTLFESATNEAPVMGALADVGGIVDEAIAITGSCTDDGQPTPPALTYQWAKTAGPGSCVFGSSTTASTTATCDTDGSVTLTLTCCDQGAAAACTGLTGSDTLTATVAVNPRSVLLAALGANLLEAGEVTDDETTVKVAITPTVNVPAVYRCDSVANFGTGGGVFAALDSSDVAAANRRPYWYPTGGPANDPHIEIAQISAVNTGLTRLWTPPTGHRYSFFAVVAMNDSPIQSSYMMVRNQVGTSVALRLQEKGMRETASAWAADTGMHVRAVYADSSLESLATFSAPVAMRMKQWRLISSVNAATGNLLEVNGTGTTPQFAQSKALYSTNAQDHFNIGDTSAVGTQAPSTKIKMWLVVNAATPAHVAAIEAYVAAKWPNVFIDSKASIGMWGQSNAEQALPFTKSVSNYINQYWHWAGGFGVGSTSLANWAPASANFNRLSEWMARADATKPLVVVWWQGETDANDATLAANYRTNWEAIVAALDVATGRTDAIYVIMRLAAGYVAPHTTTVRGHQDAWVAANPTRARIVNLDDLTRHDLVHYDNAGKIAAIGRATSFLPSIYPRRKHPPKRNDTRGGRNVVCLSSRRRQREERELVEAVKRAA